jgi:hypothetical protein
VPGKHSIRLHHVPLTHTGVACTLPEPLARNATAPIGAPTRRCEAFGRPIQACPVDSPAAHRIPRATDPTLEDTNMGNEATVGDVSAAINQNWMGRIQTATSGPIEAAVTAVTGREWHRSGADAR